MRLKRKLVIGFYIWVTKRYTRTRKKYLKFLPNTPLAKPKSKPLFILMTKYISTQFDPMIRKELSYYLKHHYELEDLQEGLGMATWLEFVKQTEGLDGDILELGIYRGGSTIMTAKFLQKLKSKRKIFACDAFIGLPNEDKFSLWGKDAKGMYGDTNAQLVLDKFKKFQVEEKIELIEGLFENTLYQKLTNKKFSLVLVDCDIYDATKISMEFVYPRMVKNGIIMFDDYDRVSKNEPVSGETVAVNEFCKNKNIPIELFPEPHIKKTN